MRRAALLLMCKHVCQSAGSAADLQTSPMSLSLISRLTQHMAGPDLVLSNTLTLKQTGCDSVSEGSVPKPVWLGRPAAGPLYGSSG